MCKIARGASSVDQRNYDLGEYSLLHRRRRCVRGTLSQEITYKVLKRLSRSETCNAATRRVFCTSPVLRIGHGAIICSHLERFVLIGKVRLSPLSFPYGTSELSSVSLPHQFCAVPNHSVSCLVFLEMALALTRNRKNKRMQKGDPIPNLDPQ